MGLSRSRFRSRRLRTRPIVLSGGTLNIGSRQQRFIRIHGRDGAARRHRAYFPRFTRIDIRPLCGVVADVIDALVFPSGVDQPHAALDNLFGFTRLKVQNGNTRGSGVHQPLPIGRVAVLIKVQAGATRFCRQPDHAVPSIRIIQVFGGSAVSAAMAVVAQIANKIWPHKVQVCRCISGIPSWRAVSPSKSNSINTADSSPTTQASCPGSIATTCGALNSKVHPSPY